MLYNFLNLPDEISMKNDAGGLKGKINYVYDATGNKLQKITTEEAAAANGNNKLTTTTTYLGGAVYESKEHQTALSTDYKHQLQFIGHEEGRIRFEKANPNNCPQSVNRFVFDYFIKDHLGNVRMVLTEQSEQTCYPAATVEAGNINAEKQLYDIKDAQIVNVSSVGGASSYSTLQSRLYETNAAPGL